jgi:hypothetical protein
MMSSQCVLCVVAVALVHPLHHLLLLLVPFELTSLLFHSK